MSDLLITRKNTDRIGFHSVLLPLFIAGSSWNREDEATWVGPVCCPAGAGQGAGKGAGKDAGKDSGCVPIDLRGTRLNKEQK